MVFLRFIDSCIFLSMGLDNIVKNIDNDDFKNSKKKNFLKNACL